MFNTQLYIVGAVITLATIYILVSMWRTWFSENKQGCGSGCGSCAKSETKEEPVQGRISLPQIRT